MRRCFLRKNGILKSIHISGFYGSGEGRNRNVDRASSGIAELMRKFVDGLRSTEFSMRHRHEAKGMGKMWQYLRSHGKMPSSATSPSSGCVIRCTRRRTDQNSAKIIEVDTSARGLLQITIVCARYHSNDVILCQMITVKSPQAFWLFPSNNFPKIFSFSINCDVIRFNLGSRFLLLTIQ